ncbi:MAG: Lrp/AsnC family transcriptional regulator [Nanoarchaeota archaeon]
MEPKNLQFLSCLRENSREKLTDISKKTNIPISTLFDMLKEMQGSVITKSTVLLNFPELGYQVHAQVFLKVNTESKERIRNHLLLNQNVNSLYKINNDWDFIVETLHKNIRELDGFMDSLNSKFKIEKHQIHYLVDELKREGFVF